MAQFPPSERANPSRRWIWFVLFGLILLGGFTYHRRRLPFPAAKDLSGYSQQIQTQSAVSFDEPLHTADSVDEGEEWITIVERHVPLTEMEATKRTERRSLPGNLQGSRIYAAEGGRAYTNFQD